MQVLLLAAALLLGLIMLPFGMPGTLVMFAAALCYYLVVPGGGVGLMTVIGTGLVMMVAEGLDLALTSRFARRFGGSRRAGWGAVLGGMVGAFVGVPLPVVGSVIGAFVGAFAGALVAELSRGSGSAVATRVAWGAFIGRVTSAAVKVGVGAVMAVWILAAALLH